MQQCNDCKFLRNAQVVPNHPQVTSVGICALFNQQILNLVVDDCTGKILNEGKDGCSIPKEN